MEEPDSSALEVSFKRHKAALVAEGLGLENSDGLSGIESQTAGDLWSLTTPER